MWKGVCVILIFRQALTWILGGRRPFHVQAVQILLPSANKTCLTSRCAFHTASDPIFNLVPPRLRCRCGPSLSSFLMLACPPAPLGRCLWHPTSSKSCIHWHSFSFISCSRWFFTAVFVCEADRELCAWRCVARFRTVGFLCKAVVDLRTLSVRIGLALVGLVFWFLVFVISDFVWWVVFVLKFVYDWFCYGLVFFGPVWW